MSGVFVKYEAEHGAFGNDRFSLDQLPGCRECVEGYNSENKGLNFSCAVQSFSHTSYNLGIVSLSFFFFSFLPGAFQSHRGSYYSSFSAVFLIFPVSL